MKTLILSCLLLTTSILTLSHTNKYQLPAEINLIPKDTITLVHNGYKTLWSSTLDYPLLVQWWDTKERIVCNQIPRKDDFGPDPLLPKETDIQKEYEGAINKYHTKSDTPRHVIFFVELAKRKSYAPISRFYSRRSILRLILNNYKSAQIFKI